MLYKININNENNSSKLLFSIPVHEEQEIINNQIENILNYNPNSKIIIHVNKSFKNFINNQTQYENVYINSKRFNYKFGKGLLWIHINNFLEAIRLNIDFDYFVIISSNEMFIKNGLIHYIEKYKNGCQIIKFDNNNDWHNFHKKKKKDPNIINLLNELKLDTIYGGQTEGQFYQKYIFQNIANIYLNIFGDNEINNFETEEIVVQTIFKSFNINYGLPITLQNYSNIIVINDDLINNIISNNIIIPNNKIKKNLISPHVNLDCSSIYSIKRIDRDFNPIRNFISKKGFILNNDEYQLNTYYYSNNSSLILIKDNHFIFNKKKSHIIKNFNWFGYEIDEGNYYIDFNIKILNKINYNEKIGLKIHYTFEYIYNYFFENLIINEWTNIIIPISIIKKDRVIFIFDNSLEEIKLEIKDLNIYKLNEKINYTKEQKNNKENIALFLYEKTNLLNCDYSLFFTNINSMIINSLQNNYNIYIFISIFDTNKKNVIINLYKHYDINIINKDDNINSIFINNIENINKFKNIYNINFKFSLFFQLDSLFNNNIDEINIYINKFNLHSYFIPYIDKHISNSYDFMLVPDKYIDKFYNLLINNKNNKNICNLIYYYLKDEINITNFNYIFNNNYYINDNTPFITYLNNSQINDIKNYNGYLFNEKYILNIYYSNKYSKFLKNNNGEFYFYKNKTTKTEPFMWCGSELNDLEIMNFSSKTIKISFTIKLLKQINYNYINFGIKTHEPISYNYLWLKECQLDIYKNIEININIYKKNQYVILCFDNYLDEIEFYIKDFKIILDYN